MDSGPLAETEHVVQQQQQQQQQQQLQCPPQERLP
jgi:hypothetical protein